MSPIQIAEEALGTARTAFLNQLMEAIVPSAFFSVSSQEVALPTYQGVDLSDATLTIMDRYISIQASPVFTFCLHPLDAARVRVVSLRPPPFEDV